jgi:hypothetical protein
MSRIVWIMGCLAVIPLAGRGESWIAPEGDNNPPRKDAPPRSSAG